MKITAKFAILGIMLSLAVGCDVERTDDNTVQISTDTAATREVAHDTETAADALAQKARDAAQATETALREGARKTGTALEEAGKEIQEHSKPGKQP
ncbi:MAG TPA: hypothetical protein VM779_00675 [Thermoanaerobaculia bacterium]|nr:hypothetical protein [Thermoanaerobaculia bacterium]